MTLALNTTVTKVTETSIILTAFNGQSFSVDNYFSDQSSKIKSVYPDNDPLRSVVITLNYEPGEVPNVKVGQVVNFSSHLATQDVARNMRVDYQPEEPFGE